MPSTILGQQAVTLPSDTTANRPSNTAGIIRHNSTNNTLEHNTGTAWIPVGHPGTSSQNPASSAVQLYNLGLRGKGFYWLTSPNGGTVLNFCDLDTVDEDGVAGWILVAAFGSSSQWSRGSNSTRKTIDPYDHRLNENSQNDQYSRLWSANWGDYTMNKFRVHMTDSVNLGGANSKADWYYHYSTACYWKQVWSFQSGANSNYMNDTSGSNSGNINAFPGWPTPVNEAGATITRTCIRGFNWSYNIKFAYKNTKHRWNNTADSSGGGQQTMADMWTLLTTPTVQSTQMYGGDTGDGSLGILPSNFVTATTSGQDMDSGHNAKIGYDDGLECAAWSTNSTNIAVTINGTVTGPYRYKAFFWIK